MAASDTNHAVEQPRDGVAERFFQWSLYLMLVTGFAALIGTNRLDLPSLVLVVPALLLRGYSLLIRRNLVLQERWATRFTVLYFAFYAADYFYFSQSFIFATVHLVLFVMVLKIFSVHRDRDLVYLALLAFMLILAAAVLTVDTMYLATFALFALAAIATFISLEMRRSARDTQAAPVPAWQTGRLYRSLSVVAAGLGGLTLLGSAVIFFILPRLNSMSYLRNLGVQSNLTSGFASDVSLGGIGQIQQSSAVVMHVQVLEGKLPQDVKWRGIALATFDGRRWRNAELPQPHALGNAAVDLVKTNGTAFYSGAVPPPAAPTLRYRVLMEPVGLNVFFLVPVPLKLRGDYPLIQTSSDGAVSNVPGGTSGGGPEGPYSVGIYTAEADTRDPAPFVRTSNSSDYPPGVSNLYLELPRVDPRVVDLARKASASANSNYARARAIESYLKANFGYTLELPGDRARDPLAYFLFERKKGHCEYFASSMTIMLRTLGIPARVVNGFRGGEYNDLTSSYIVRERDAHSWVEAYFPEYGWVTFDPTPGGAGAATSRWARLALYLDAAQQMWREWIINYDFSHQLRLSREISNTTSNAQSTFRLWAWSKYRTMVSWMGTWQRRMQRMSTEQMAVACVLLGILLALPFAPKAVSTVRTARLRRNPRRAPRSAASFWYLRMLKRLARRGIRKTPAQTPSEFASSIADPHVRDDVVIFTRHYERARFAESVEDAERLPELYEEMVGKK